MYELRRLKRYGFVSLGKYQGKTAAFNALDSITFVTSWDDTATILHGEDGYTYEIKYV